MNVIRRVELSHETGFSLVEVMVSIVAGLIVVGAVLAFTVSSVRANAEYVNATRLTQELRNTIDFVSRELRRSGYDQNYLAQLARVEGSTEQSDFSPIFLNPIGPCLAYAYDRLPGTPGQLDPANGELRGIRRRVVGGVGVMEVATSEAANPAVTCGGAGATANYATYPATCAGNWCPLTDNRLLNITDFQITDVSPAPIGGTAATALPMRIREFEIRLRGSLVGNPAVARGVMSRVRVRADCLRTGATPASVIAACTAVPAP